MSISKTIDIAMRQAIPNPLGSCRACERSGLPILLLRTAYAPDPRDTRSRPLAAGSEVTAIPMRTDQLRTLRQGYVYVLLDRELWHAYQVTPEGALRQFPATQPPLAPGPPLESACHTQGHDVIASFININTELYTTAWLAFANDPWPTEVLDRHRHGVIANDAKTLARFVELDLHAARHDPASVGIAMTEHELGLEQVLEYATVHAGKFTSAHGFYPRLSRLAATSKHIRTTIQKEQLSNGVLAMTLPDPVGFVQECNAQRTAYLLGMQTWRAEPQRNFEYFTSQALLGIRELHDAWAVGHAADEIHKEAEQVERWNNSPIGSKAFLPAVDIEQQTQRRTEQKRQEARERLEERYDEAARAAFQAHYDREVKHWQILIDQVGQLYASHYERADFQDIAHGDYSAIDPVSVQYFIRMMAACFYGGPSEALPREGEPLGPTQQVWQRLLEDHKGLLYEALLARDQGLIEQLAHALTGDDLGKLHDTVKGIAGSFEGLQFMIKPVQDAIGQLLAATASAGTALHQHLSERSLAMIGHLHRTALLRHARQETTLMKVTLTLGEYLSLLNEALEARTDAYLGQLDQQFRKPAERKVRAMVLSGAINIAAAGNRNQLVEVMIWSLDSAENLQARLLEWRETASGSVSEVLRSVSIGTDMLHDGFARTRGGVMVGADAAREMTRDALRSLRGTPGATTPMGATLLLALGSVWFQQDSLMRNYAALQQTHQSNPEVLAAIGSSSLGMLGAGIEATGLVVQTIRPERVLPGVGTTISLGTSIARYGGAVAALAGIMDGTQYLSAAARTQKQGDIDAAQQYYIASFFAIVSASAGVTATVGLGSIFGPLGVAIVVSLAAYTTATYAKKIESSLTELWSRHSRWGRPSEQRYWLKAHDLDAAIGALNAAYIGVTAEASINTHLTHFDTLSPSTPVGAIISDGTAVPAGFALDYHLHLPKFSPELSHYHWALSIYHLGANNKTTIFSGDSETYIQPSTSSTSDLFSSSPSEPLLKFDPNNHTLNIQGTLPLKDNHGISAIELSLKYWPDRNDESAYAKLVVKEDSLDWRI